MKLFLIGLLGSGKSFLGREIARVAKLPFIDLDEVIEQQEGMKVSEIFAARGQAYFRIVEAAALRKQSEAAAFVMATGGGAPCFHESMTFINQAGTSVFLNTPVQEIIKRLGSVEKKQRPLLEHVPDEKIQQTLEEMLQNRLVFYQQAHITVNGSTTTAQEILQRAQPKK
jgi:shikimate kinase